MRAFETLYMDAAIVVVDKAAGVLTVPTARRERSTLVELVERLVGGGARGGRGRVHVVHRLDRDTSGVIVFARTEPAARALMASWRHAHERRYACLVHGVVAKDDGEIRSHLVTERNLDRRSSQDGRGELAVTRWEVERRLDNATLMAVALDTGRRNQIRVHMAEAGHPILGDVRYARHVTAHPRWPPGVLALHARLLRIVHPVTREEMTFESALPDAFQRFLHTASADGRRGRR